MYAALWRRIPGGLPAKIAGMLGLLLSALALLFFVVFPFVEPRLPWNKVTVDTPQVPAVPTAVVSPSASSSGAVTPAVSPSVPVSPSALVSPSAPASAK